MKKELINLVIETLEEEHCSYFSPIVVDLKEKKFLIVNGWDAVNYITDTLDCSMEEFIEEVCGDEDLWGFNDEYTTCSDCGYVIRTSPTSYSWTPDFIIRDGEILCSNCSKNRIEEIIEEDYCNNDNMAITCFEIEDLEKIGYTLIDEEYENGWYGVTDNPKEIMKELHEEYEDVIFIINSTQQFTTYFSAMVRGKIKEEINETI